VGKTHLLHAVGNELVATRGGAALVACVNARDFTDELIRALQDGTIERWRVRYRVLDVLLMDDVQQLAGSERTQDELFHLFNSLYAAGRQIVLAADRVPGRIEGLEDRLRSRFEGGLVVEMQRPDHALREKFFARQLAASGQRVDRALLEYLAARPVSSVAEVSTLVMRLRKAADVVGVPLTAALARKELEGSFAAPSVTRTTPGRSVDESFLDEEKVVWEWPELSGRAIEDYR
jgi:chromosomal replication initiator protein